MTNSKNDNRPSYAYTEELADWVLEVIATTTAALDKLTKTRANFPSSTVINHWRAQYPEFNAAYEDAMAHRADLFMEEALAIADNVDPDLQSGIGAARVRKAELQVKVRQMHAARYNRRNWGSTRVEHESKVTNYTRPDLSQLTMEDLKMLEEMAKKLGDGSGVSGLLGTSAGKPARIISIAANEKS